MWVEAERSQHFLFSSELGITMLIWQEKKQQHPKPFYLLLCHVGQSKHRVKGHFWGALRFGRKRLLQGFRFFATPVPLYLYDSALVLNRQWLESRQREPPCPRLRTFTCSLPSHPASL